MGRKIPGKKHRGVKDPLKQQAKRKAELETKINAPPKNIDEQAIPKSLEHLMKLREAVKSGKIIKSKKKKVKSKLICVGEKVLQPSHPKAKPDKVVPIFKQYPNESEERFMFRVNRETDAFIKETAFEKKYGVQVKRNADTGRIEGLNKCSKSEVDDIEMLRAKHRNIMKKKKKKSNEVRLTKSEKRKEKLRLRKEKKEKEVDEFQNFEDRVEFGEVAHEPPQLKTRPRAADVVSSIKPGKKDLLLHSLLKQNQSPKKLAKKSAPIDKSGKRKNLPFAERRQLDKAQSDVIAAYRRLKLQRPT